MLHSPSYTPTRTVDRPALRPASARRFGPAPSDPFGAIIGRPDLISIEMSYGKDQEIYGEGEPAEYVYQVMSGAVRTYKLLNDGRRQVGAFFLPGDVFGLDSSPTHCLTAEAIGDAGIRLLSRRQLEVAATLHVAIAHKLWTMTAADLRHAEAHMLLLGRKTALERVATFLLEMDKRLTVRGMIALPMSRRDIADYLGLTLETVSRALSALNDKGVIAFTTARQIMICRRDQLRTLDA